MTSHTILTMYQALAHTGQHMLAAATHQEWHRFIELAEQMAEQTAALQTTDVDITLSREQNAHKRDLIECYLACQHEIKAAITPRMAVLATILNAAGTANIIQNLYASTP